MSDVVERAEAALATMRARESLFYPRELLEELVAEVKSLRAQIGPALEPCRACGGHGTWETECCNGASGCPCRGGLVEMGSCRACGGYGAVDQQRPMANAEFILNNNIGYPGGGPSDGWLK
jgi:hypothetical protein